MFISPGILADFFLLEFKFPGRPLLFFIELKIGLVGLVLGVNRAMDFSF